MALESFEGEQAVFSSGPIRRQNWKVNTTEKETILKRWEKTKLSGGFDLDEQMLDPDFEEEFLLSELMKDLIFEE